MALAAIVYKVAKRVGQVVVEQKGGRDE